MVIPINAQVECTDGIYGRSVYVLINPMVDQVVYVVVEEDSAQKRSCIVPAGDVSVSQAGTIQLGSYKSALNWLPRFEQTKFIQETGADDSNFQSGVYWLGSSYYIIQSVPKDC